MTTRRWMIAVALSGGLLSVLRPVWHARSDNNRPHESLLMVGRRVVTFSEGGAEVTTFVNNST
jgi:hypothetical protein